MKLFRRLPEALDTFQAQINAYIKLITEHGIARVAVAGGLAMVSVVLFMFANAGWENWPASQIFVVGGVVMIGIGSFVRWAEMHYKLLSGRTMVLRCAKCQKPLRIETLKSERSEGKELKSPLQVGELKPPLFGICSNSKCRAFNLIQ